MLYLKGTIFTKKGNLELNIRVERVNQVNKLFEVIDSCTMNVELVTGEGDCLNMKSKLSQYLSMTRMFANGDVPQMELVAKNEQDAQKLIDFLKEDAEYQEPSDT